MRMRKPTSNQLAGHPTKLILKQLAGHPTQLILTI
jgi:hypothetical protein